VTHGRCLVACAPDAAYCELIACAVKAAILAPRNRNKKKKNNNNNKKKTHIGIQCVPENQKQKKTHIGIQCVPENQKQKKN